MTQDINALNIRVWYVEGGVHPSRVPQMFAQGKFGDPSHSHGVKLLCRHIVQQTIVLRTPSQQHNNTQRKR